MDHDQAMAVARRLLALVEAGGTEQADGVFPVPVAEYVDPDRWRAEVDRLFLRSPLVLAASCQLPEPGDHLARDLVGRPVLAVRGDDGQARVFLRVCRHRGAVLCPEGGGHARRFTCPYHAWTYDTKGRLVGVPGRDTFGDLGELTADERGLVELPSEERHGLVFAVLSPGGSIDVDEWLGDFGPELASLGLARMHPFRSSELAGPNWKVAADGYLDGYHFGALHRNTLGRAFLSNSMAVHASGPHQRICFAARSITDLRGRPEDTWLPIDHLGLVVHVFPGTAFATGGGTDSVLMSQVVPGDDVLRSRTFQTHLLAEAPSGPEEEAAADSRVGLLEYVVREEDYATGLGIGAALGSGANREFLFGRNEPANQHLHRWIRRLVGAPLG